MDDFVILTDSCCDMTARMAADLELEVLPLSLNMEDRVYHNYLDGREIGFQDFYARLRAGALATTSAISVGVFDEAMRGRFWIAAGTCCTWPFPPRSPPPTSRR